jgi:hypothetical protein
MKHAKTSAQVLNDEMLDKTAKVYKQFLGGEHDWRKLGRTKSFVIVHIPTPCGKAGRQSPARAALMTLAR